MHKADLVKTCTLMKLKGQYKKIIDLCWTGEWTCQAAFWTISKSPHKRRKELEQMGYLFEERRCTHGIKASKDFRLMNEPTKRVQVVEQLPDNSVRVTYQDEQVSLFN